MDYETHAEWVSSHMDYIHAVERNVERRLTSEEVERLELLARENGYNDIDRLNAQLQELGASLTELTNGFVKTLQAESQVNTECQCKMTLEGCIIKQAGGLGTCCLYCEHESNVE